MSLILGSETVSLIQADQGDHAQGAGVTCRSSMSETRRGGTSHPVDFCDAAGVSTVGYARVSTDHQSLLAQRDALTAAGCDRIFTDQMSGVREDRPGLAQLLDYVRPGDTVVVVALDRLGRSLSGVIRTIETLTERGVLLRSLREGIDYSTPTGRMLAGIFAALAAYERELMHERAAAARQAARLRGRHTGRPPRPSPDPAGPVAARRRGTGQRLDAHLRGVASHGVPGTAAGRCGRATVDQYRHHGRVTTHAFDDATSRWLGKPRRLLPWSETRNEPLSVHAALVGRRRVAGEW